MKKPTAKLVILGCLIINFFRSPRGNPFQNWFWKGCAVAYRTGARILEGFALMARLNLSSQRLNAKTIEISWTDRKPNDTKGLKVAFFSISIFALFIAGMVFVFQDKGFGLLALTPVTAIIYTIWFHGSSSKPNSVKFSTDTVTHRGRSFSTDEITRFEYGLQSQLTGIMPETYDNGHRETDPHLIRMWINDASAYEVSANNWQTQVNHEIRDALASALDQVRKDQAAVEHEKAHGKAGDFGLPDY
jgi:hypothetical protein